MVRSNHLMKFALCKKAVRLTKGGGYYLIHSEVLLIDSTNLFFTLGSQNWNWSTLMPSDLPVPHSVSVQVLES